MGKLQLDSILQLVDVDIKQKVFTKISRATAGLQGNLGGAAGQAQRLDRTMQGVAKSTLATERNLAGANRVARQFVQRMAQFAILLPTFATLNRAIQGGVKFIAEFETELKNILRIDISGLRDRLDEVADSALNIAIEFGATATEVIGTIRVFKQAGLEIEDAMEKARIATLATRVSTLSLTNATEALIAVSKQFAFAALEDIEVLDKLAKVEDEAAVGAQDIAEALRTGGNALGFASKSFDDTIGLIAGLREQSRKTGREIGTFFKTLSTRLLAAGEARNAVEELGVTVENADGSLRPLLNILLDLEGAFDALTEAEAATAAKSIAGVRQFESLLATLKSVERAHALSATSADAQGTAEAKLAEVNQTLAVETQRAVAEFQKLAVSLSDTGALDVLKSAVKFAQGLAIGLQEATEFADKIGVSLLPLLGAGGIALGKSIFSGGAGGAKGDPVRAAEQTAVKTNTVAFKQHTETLRVGKRTLQVRQAQQSALARLSDKDLATRLNMRLADERSIKTTAKNNRSLLRVARGFGDLGKSTGALIIGAQFAGNILRGMADELEGVRINLLGFQADISNTARNLAGSFQTATTFGLLLGKKAGIVAGVLQLAATAVSGFVSSLQDARKARRELKEGAQANSARNTLANEILGGGELSQIIVKGLGQAFVNAGGELGSEFFKSAQNVVRQAVAGDERFRGLDLGTVFGDKDVFHALIIAAGDFGVNLDTLRDKLGDTDLAAINVGLGFSALFEDLGKSADASFDKLARFFDFGEILDDAGAVKKIVELENQLVGIRVEAADANNLLVNVEQSQLETLRNRVAAEEELARIQSKSVIGLQSRALTSPTALGQPASDPRRTLDLINNLREAIRTGSTEIERDGATIRVTLENLVQGLERTAIQPEKVADALKILTAEFEAETKVAAALAAVEAKIREERETLTEISTQQQKELLDVEKDRAQGLVELAAAAGTLGFELTGALKEFVGPGIDEITAAEQKFQIEADALSIALDQARMKLEELTAQGEAADFSKVQEATKKVADLEVSLAETRVEQQQEVAAATIDAIANLNNAQQKLQEELKSSSQAFSEFANDRTAEFARANADAQEELAQAEQEVLSANADLESSYSDLLSTILEFNDAMAEARVEANLIQVEINSLGGGVNGFRERLGALNNAFTSVLNDANISLSQRIQLERQLAEETLTFIRQTQDELTSAGLQVFGQDAESNRNLQVGIDGLRLVADKLGGSFDNFLNLSTEDFSQIGDQLLNLPVDLRSSILDALRTLPSTTNIGGFSPEELERAIGQVGTGVAPEAGLPSVEELLQEEKEQLEKIQELTIEDAELQLAQVLAAQEQVELAKSQLEEAELLRDRSEQNLMDVRDAILEEQRILEAADALRVELTDRLIQAGSADRVEMIQAQAAAFAEQTGEIGAKLQGVIDAIAAVQINVANAAGVVNGARGFVPNFGRGNLNVNEIGGLIAAARREKAMMPAGAGLAVANTSETIIPSRARGFIPNFQSGNQSPISAGINSVRGINETVVAAISRSVTQALVGLEDGNGDSETNRQIVDSLSQIRAELENLNTSNDAINSTLEDSAGTGGTATGGTAQQAQAVSIDVSINDRQTVTVTGLDQLPDAISAGVQEAAATGTDQKLQPVIEQLQSIIQGLRERNIISSFGQAQ